MGLYLALVDHVFYPYTIANEDTPDGGPPQMRAKSFTHHPASGVRNPRPTRPRRATRPVLVLAPRARRRSSAAARLLQPDGLKVLAASAVRLGEG